MGVVFGTTVAFVEKLTRKAGYGKFRVLFNHIGPVSFKFLIVHLNIFYGKMGGEPLCLEV